VPLDGVWPTPAAQGGRLSAVVNLSGHGSDLNGTVQASITGKEEDAPPPWAEANIRFVHGVGAIQGVLGIADSTGHVQGDIDLVHRSVRARGTAAQISWNEKRLGRIDLAIAVNERR